MDKKVLYLILALTVVILGWGVWALSDWSSQTNDDLNRDSILGQNNSTIEGNGMNNKYSTAPVMAIDSAKTYSAVVETTKGTMKFNLFAAETPVTVNNFVFLSRENFYNGTKFHRIIKDFMIQGGDPLGTGTGGPGYKFDDEPITRDYKRGVLVMANSGPNTNGSQFFIMTQETALSKDYVIFGELVEGTETLDAIANTPVTKSGTGEQSVPTEMVLIDTVSILEQ